MSAALVAARGWLSLSEAATYLGVSSDYLRGAVADSRLRAYRRRQIGRASCRERV